MALAEYTSSEEPYTRQAFSDEDRAAREVLRVWMEEAGLEVRVDAAANMIGRRRGRHADAPALVLGSHIDTVQSGGRFDGMAGVAAALEVVRAMDRAGVSTERPVEVINFTCEEPTVVGMSPMGSRAMAGCLDLERLHTTQAPQGRTLAQAIDFLGGDSATLEGACRRPQEVAAYLELHIEQGSVLERRGYPVGVVTAIAAPARAEVAVIGRADHAGATMMEDRRDALCGAAELILALERAARDPSLKDAVATIGVIRVHPGMVNIIPGRVEFRAETRSVRQEEKERVKQALVAAAAQVAEQRGLTVNVDWVVDEPPVPVPPEMLQLVQAAAAELAIPTLALPSRAAHDANWMAEIAPMAMVFVPSRDGLSHCPEEWSDFKDIAAGARVLGRALLKLDRKP